ncbi:MAG: hypothetical protein Aureis2KO_25580 [Aureisphaera sp.]
MYKLQRFNFLPCILLLLCLYSPNNYAQESEPSVIAAQLKQDIEAATEGPEKLKLLDSLTHWIEDHELPGYETQLQETIDYAIQIDSSKRAIQYATKFLDYLAPETAQFPKAIATFQHYIPIFEPYQNWPELCEFYMEGGRTYAMSSLFVESQEYLDQAYALGVKAQDSILIGTVKELNGHNFAMMGDFEKSTATLQESIDIFSNVSPSDANSVKTSLSILYSQNGLQQEAKSIREEVVASAKSQGDINLVYTTFYNQAFDEMLHGTNEERIRYLDSAAIYVNNIEDDYPHIELSISQLSAYSQMGDLEKAEGARRKLMARLDNAEETNFPEFFLSMAHYEYAKGNYNQAANWAERELEALQETNFYEGIYTVNRFLSKTYNKLGQHKKAYDYFETYRAIKDSIESVQKANGFSYYQTKLETEKKEAKIAVQNSEIQVLDAQNKTKNQWIIIGSILALSLIVIIILGYYARYNRKKKTLQTEFSQNLIKDRESQYAHIARELHDSIGQKLMLLVKKTNLDKREELKFLAKDSLEEVRTISRGLHPDSLRSTGITDAISALVDSIDQTTDIIFMLEVENIDGTLGDERELHLYRILQESLNNLVKHSGAKAAFVDIEKLDGEIKATVSDNGKGFSFQKSINKGSLGMKTLLERAEIIGSKLHINSQENKGTKITLTIPI